MVIYGVSFDMVGKQPIVLLKAVDTNKFLPIWIGHPEAAAILMKLQGAIDAAADDPRPAVRHARRARGRVHARLGDRAAREHVLRVDHAVSERTRGRDRLAAVSDALALAVRSGAPIFAAEDVIAESAIEFEHEVEDTEEVVDKFKEFLDQRHAGGLRAAATSAGSTAVGRSSAGIDATPRPRSGPRSRGAPSRRGRTAVVVNGRGAERVDDERSASLRAGRPGRDRERNRAPT